MQITALLLIRISQRGPQNLLLKHFLLGQQKHWSREEYPESKHPSQWASSPSPVPPPAIPPPLSTPLSCSVMTFPPSSQGNMEGYSAFIFLEWALCSPPSPLMPFSALTLTSQSCFLLYHSTQHLANCIYELFICSHATKMGPLKAGILA